MNSCPLVLSELSADEITSSLAIFGASAYTASPEWLAAVASSTRLRLARQRRQSDAAEREAGVGEGEKPVERGPLLSPRDLVGLIDVIREHPAALLLLGESRPVQTTASSAVMPEEVDDTPSLLNLLLSEAGEQADAFSPRQIVQIVRALASMATTTDSGSSRAGSTAEAVCQSTESALELSGALAPLLGAVGAATAEAPLSLAAAEVAALLRAVAEVGGWGKIQPLS